MISGIIHVIRSGLIWRDAPNCYGPHKTLYNREAGAVLATEGAETGTVMIDATHLKAHRTAASLLRLFRAISDLPEADSTRSSTRSATALAGP